jgi:hypothetical protein
MARPEMTVQVGVDAEALCAELDRIEAAAAAGGPVGIPDQLPPVTVTVDGRVCEVGFDIWSEDVVSTEEIRLDPSGLTYGGGIVQGFTNIPDETRGVRPDVVVDSDPHAPRLERT